MIPHPGIDPHRREMCLARGWWREDRTVLDDFLDHAQVDGDRMAIVADVAGGPRRSLSYRQLRTLVDRTAMGLHALGVRRGEPVSYQLPNWWQFAALSLACLRIGAVANPILPILREREVGHILATLGSRVVVVPASFRGFDHVAMLDVLRARLPALQHVLAVGTTGAGASSFEDTLLAPRWEDRPDAPDLEALRPGPDDVVEVQFTSGTTGSPKGVVHTPNTIWASYRSMSRAMGLGAEDVVHVPTTMAHQLGFLNGVVMAFAEGMKAVYQDVWDPHRMLDLVADEAVTYSAGGTPLLLDLFTAVEERAADGRRVDLSSLRCFKSGGAPVPSSVVRRAHEQLGTRVVMSWGMTENGACTVTRPQDPPEEVAASDGFPAPWVELRITDPNGRELPEGDEGVLRIRSASQCIGYLPDHRLWLDAHDDAGWFDTGDLARLRPDGSLRITGRVKEMIVRGGENVPVREVEDAIAAHPAIAEVALVPVPDARLGERAWAAVVPADGADAPDLALVQRHLAALGMARQYWPEFVSVHEQLPRTGSGKIRKAEVRRDALARHRVGDAASEAPAASAAASRPKHRASERLEPGAG